MGAASGPGLSESRRKFSLRTAAAGRWRHKDWWCAGSTMALHVPQKCSLTLGRAASALSGPLDLPGVV